MFWRVVSLGTGSMEAAGILLSRGTSMQASRAGMGDTLFNKFRYEVIHEQSTVGPKMVLRVPDGWCFPRALYCYTVSDAGVNGAFLTWV
jgi:hypothetical protein